MSRGGRGGGGTGRVGDLDVDPQLEQEAANAFRDQNGDLDDWSKTLYPPMTVYNPPAPTALEKKLVATWRTHRNAMRNGPLFIDTPKTGKRDVAEFNAFEDIPTFGNKRAKRGTGLPNLKKVPIVKEMLPRELWDVVSDGEEENGTGTGTNDGGTKKDLSFLRKKRLDKLAQFDEGADAPAADDEDAADEEDDEEDAASIPEDDDFSEDEDDEGNDYNAEQYFDNGDGADDDGDDAGGDDACDMVHEHSTTVHGQRMAKVHEDKNWYANRYAREEIWSTNVWCEKSRAIAAARTLEERSDELAGFRKKKVSKRVLTWEQIRAAKHDWKCPGLVHEPQSKSAHGDHMQREASSTYTRKGRHGLHMATNVFDENARAWLASDELEQRMGELTGTRRPRPKGGHDGMKRTKAQKDANPGGYRVTGHAC